MVKFVSCVSYAIVFSLSIFNPVWINGAIAMYSTLFLSACPQIGQGNES